VGGSQLIAHGLALEICSVPFRTQQRPVINVSLRVAPAKGSVLTQTFCTRFFATRNAKRHLLRLVRQHASYTIGYPLGRDLPPKRPTRVGNG
jgi:hypothetical protein